jgi:uncharacterized NAD-dependent epimerase/dehydratase family protein
VIVGVASRGGRSRTTGSPACRPSTSAWTWRQAASGWPTSPFAAAAKRNGASCSTSATRRSRSVADGKKQSGKRLLTVGTDCSVGKMFTALALEGELRRRGVKADFRATGQTGILIAGGGVSIDAVVADFIAGATEWLSPANEPDHWDLVEGQGSLFHASYAGVSLGLLHGSAADALVMCHESRPASTCAACRPIRCRAWRCIRVNEEMGRLTNPNCKVIGTAVNTSALDAAAAERYLKEQSDRFGMPAVDPVHRRRLIVDVIA